MKLMNKRIRSILLVFCLMMPFLPFSVSASEDKEIALVDVIATEVFDETIDETYDEPILADVLAANVCEMDGVGFPTLDAALAAANVGESSTITLLTNIDYNDNLKISNKNITFDLASYDLNVINSAFIGVTVVDGANVTYTGSGEFNATGRTTGIYVSGGSSAVVSNATVTGDDNDYYGASVSEHSQLTIEGNVLGIASRSTGAQAYGKDAILVVKGNVTGGAYGISAVAEGYIAVHGNVEATDVRGTGAYANQSKLLIKGNVTGYRGAYTNGEITIEGNVYAKANGVTASGNSILHGLIFVGKDVFATNEDGIGVDITGTASITIHGKIVADHFIQMYATRFADIEADRTIPTTKEGYHTYTHNRGTVWVKATKPMDENVCEIGEIQYATLDLALQAAPNNTAVTIKLRTDIHQTNPITLLSKNITLDLNGHVLDVITPKDQGTYGAALYANNTTLALIGAGALNVAGWKYGVFSENSWVTLTNATANEPFTGIGAYAGTTKGELTVNNAAIGQGYGVFATGYDVDVMVKGDATGTVGRGAHATNGASIKVQGNVAGKTYGAYLTGLRSTAKVFGNVTATAEQGIGVYVDSTAEATIEGTITANVYVKVDGGTVKTIGETTIPTTKMGYFTYSHRTSSIWVKQPSIPSEAICEINGKKYATLDDALLEVQHEEAITLLKHIDYNKGIIIKDKRVDFDLNGFTLNVTNNSGTGLSVENGVVLAMGIGEMNVSGTNYGVLVSGVNSIVNVTNASSTDGGFGIYALNTGTEVVISNNVYSNGVGVYANQAQVTVKESVDAGNIGVMSASGANISVIGGIVANSNASCAIVINTGSVFVNGSIQADYCGGQIVETGSIIVGEDLIASAANSTGIILQGTGTVVIEGKITAIHYLKLSDLFLSQEDWTLDNEKPGYLMYANGIDRKVWVKGTPTPVSHTITAQNDGNGIATATPTAGQAGTEIVLTAKPNSGYHFIHWQVIAPATLVIANDKFVMPNEHVMIKAIFEKNTGSGGSPSGRPSNKPSPTPILSPTLDLAIPINIDVAATVDGKGVASVVIPYQTLTERLKTALASATQTIPIRPMALNVNVQSPKQVTAQRILLSQMVLQQLLDHNIQSLALHGTMFTLVLNQLALQEIKKKTDSDIIFTLVANVMTNNQPNIRMDLQASKDGKPIVLQALEQGTMIVRIPYTAKKEEDIGNLIGQHIDPQGNATRILQSLYHSNQIIFTTQLFSTFGVGYATPASKPTDIISHHAKVSIDYALSRGWMNSLTLSAFSDSAITREQLVVALGKLAKIDVNQAKGNGFFDVKSDSKALPYMEWANQTGIVSVVGINQFLPSGNVTREKMALMVVQYAKTMGILLPRLRTTVTFQDQDKISVYALNAVQVLQQAGILMGKQNQMFHPLANVTRAELATILHRLASLGIDPATLQGWARNDDGQMFYYQDGKVITGWHTIASHKYFFDANGVMQMGWKYDQSNKRLYLTSQGANTGWSFIDGNTYHFSKEGFMTANTWLEIDKQWYYFYSNGSLAINATIGIYQVDANGVRTTK